MLNISGKIQTQIGLPLVFGSMENGQFSRIWFNGEYPVIKMGCPDIWTLLLAKERTVIIEQEKY